MCCDVMGMDYVCNDDPEVEDTREVNEKSACVPTTNYFRPVFLGSPF
jgi:hypothetical protein